MELWAGNERAHRHVRLTGLEADVFGLPTGGPEGGDLCALFSCGAERVTRIVLADCVGHGFDASRVAAHVHQLLHAFRDVRDTAGLLAALNNEFTLSGQTPGAPLRLTTVVTATFDPRTGEFNFAYAAHPRMLLWSERWRRWQPIGEGLEGLPLGFIAGEVYSQLSVRLEPGDTVLAFSDGAIETRSPAGEQLTARGFRELAQATMARVSRQPGLQDLVVALFEAIGRFHGAGEFEDDLTLLALRRTPPGEDRSAA